MKEVTLEIFRKQHAVVTVMVPDDFDENRLFESPYARAVGVVSRDARFTPAPNILDCEVEKIYSVCTHATPHPAVPDLTDLIEFADSLTRPVPAWNPKHDQEAPCVCGHPYERHFDSYDDMRPVGCKYCECDWWRAPAP